MGPNLSLLHILILSLTLQISRVKPDPNPLQDYCVADAKRKQSFFINGAPCIDPELATASHFATSALSKPGNTKANSFGFNVTLATTDNLPGLNTMGLTLARVDLALNGLVPPHSHPRASEVTICLQGSLLVGFVDTSNRLFTRTLSEGDSFVFPKGLIHFLYNRDINHPAFALSGFSSQNPGSQLQAIASFVSNPEIPVEILANAFKITHQDVQRIRKNLGG